MDQEELKKAIVSAIKQGFAEAQAAETLNQSEVLTPPSNESNNQPNPIQNQQQQQPNKTSTVDAIKSGTNTVTGAGGMLAGALAEGGAVLLDYFGDQNEAIETNLSYIYELQKAYGGVSEAQIAAGQASDTMAGHAIEAAEHLMLTAAGQKESALEMNSGALAGTNALRMIYKDFAEAAEYYTNTLSELQGTNANAVKSVQALGEEELERIAALGKRMQISDMEMSDMLARQYAFSGEASAKVFEDIAAVSTELAKTTGTSAEGLKKDILSIMQDTKTFGDIGVDSAGRIAAAINQLGVDFQTFQNMTQNFMNFDTAAGKMGELSALFGIQMDAMEMTYLANEDQEEFLFRMREEIMDAGIDVENMSKTRQRFLADQVGVSVTQLQTFLREGEMMADQEDMFAATDQAEQIDGLAAGIDNFGGAFEGATKKAEDFKKELRAGMIIPVRDDLLMLHKTGQATVSAIVPQVPPEAIENMRTSIALEIKAIESQQANIQVGVEFLNEAMGQGANMLGKLLDVANIDGNVLSVDANHTIQVTADDLTKTQLSNLTLELEQQEKRSAIDKQNVESLLKAQGLQQTVIDQVITELGDQKEVKISIDLDADKIGDKIFTIREGNQNGKYVFVEDN